VCRRRRHPERLIFEPGFSTAEKVTNLSGRGVGMDVVRRNIEALRGTVTLHSDPGAGSHRDPPAADAGDHRRLPGRRRQLEVHLPARRGGRGDREPRPPTSHAGRRGRGIVELRGQVLPVVSLRALYGWTARPERSSVVVLPAGARRYGVMVDQLLGQHQTVIKPLGRMFRSLRGMSGSSILGNGEVALIFDVSLAGQLAAQPARMPDTRPLVPRHPVSHSRPFPHPSPRGQAP
jgi:two-component system, chemotaxis family, sensor kinase CheA